MKLKGGILYLIIVLLCSSVYAQQRIEIGTKIGFQTPKFWNGSFSDITTKKDSWVRPVIGVYSKYHLNQVFFGEYDLEISAEGGGFDQRRTHLTFLKNTLFMGVSTKTNNLNSYNFKLGVTYNVLLMAKLKDTYKQSETDVIQYFNRSSLSFPFALGYVRKLAKQNTIGINAYFQILSGPLSPMEHIEYAQTLQRVEISVSRFIGAKNE